MRLSSKHRDTNRQERPSKAYALCYSPNDDWCFPNLPVTGLYDCVPEPESEPIRQLHQHKTLEIGYCHAGTGILMVEDRVMSYTAGDASVVNHNEMHMSRSANDCTARWTYFWVDPAALLASVPYGLEFAGQDVFGGPGFCNIISPKAQPDICRTVARLIDEIRDEKALGRRMMIRTLAEELMTLLHRMHKDRKLPEGRPARTSVERVSPALQHLLNHYAEEVNVQELADLCHLSVTHFRRVFLAAVGMPPVEYLSGLRARMAAAMLQEQPDRPIMEVAFKVGFESHNTFHRHFCQTMGVSPREWRGHTRR